MREREMQFPLRVSRDRLDPVLPLANKLRITRNSKMFLMKKWRTRLS